MSKYFFEYGIRKLTNSSEEITSDYMMFIEKDFNSTTNDFNYQLTLVIRREFEQDSKGKIKKQIFPDEKLKYLHILHGKDEMKKPVYAMLKFENESVFKDSFELSSRDVNGKDINKKYRYLKYVYNGLREDDITGFGIFGFSKEINEEPSLDNRYHYFCNFHRKTDINYFTEKKSGKVNIKIIVPEIKEDLKFRVAYSDKPTYKYINFLDSEIIVSKKKSKKVFSKTINCNNDASDFRLFFVNELDNRFFFLVENKSVVNKETEKVVSSNTKQLKLCPYCLRELGDNALNKVGTNYPYAVDCQGRNLTKKSVRLASGLSSKPVFYCNKYYFNLDANLEKMVFPEHYMETQNVLISVLGLPASGKSVFFSSLFGLQNGIESNLTYLNGCLKKFNLNFTLQVPDSLGRVETQSYAANKFKHQTFIPLEDDEEYEDDFLNSTTYENYKINQDVTEFLRTSTDVHFLPFILSSDQVNLILYDIAGEDAAVERNLTNEERKFSEDKSSRINAAGAFIVLVSPQDSTFNDTVQRIINAKEINKNKPIAVVLSKFDQLDKNNFDANCACLRDEISSLYDATYEGSALQKNIDNASLEIKEYVKAQFKNFPVNELEGFTNVRYFALSSLGEKECVSESGAINFYNTPFRVELPLIWILYHTKVIG